MEQRQNERDVMSNQQINELATMGKLRQSKDARVLVVLQEWEAGGISLETALILLANTLLMENERLMTMLTIPIKDPTDEYLKAKQQFLQGAE